MPAHARAARSGAAVLIAAARAGAAAIAVAALATACGVPPELRDPPGSVVPSPKTAPPTDSPPPVASDLPPTGGPSATPTFGEDSAVLCHGRPSGAQVMALLRSTAGLLPRGESAEIRSDTPLCAGTWQYSVIVVRDRDPLMVVTRGAPGALTLVTAGTNVCNIPVRTSAPEGIRTVACEAGPAPGTV
ncbi:hypothetical protein RB614_41825 [Phytohabitans sp. ZYX-F-186]|uniref:Lipoprotein n=1 Tax=Phytohabitans maris TaxID=3071409 RepID=A0ABU0ZVS5_9ACTN|nr:hypothetical protein [Phytohabitans sp. ZYX-F-186]MDQ7911048.1 hypothetical protein [Phytohabitans sp. ZYX-F-186]